MDKRGQFYIIAALLIVLLFTGLTKIYVSVKATDEGEIFYSIADEAHYETTRFIESEIYEKKSDGVIAEDIKDGLVNFYTSKHPDMYMVIVYGNITNAYLINRTGVENVDPSSTFNKVIVELNEEEREVEIKESVQNLYVLMSIDREKEKIIIVR